ncbi:hypothetical protein PPS11_15101 [Pseudomonas putida S11]|nr:hypothetical protein PPS11_15101 [Pseudomonas putida S11]
MSITHFKNTDSAVLDSSNPVAVPLGEPRCIDFGHLRRTQRRRRNRHLGVHPRALASADRAAGVSAISSRAGCTFTPDGGEPLLIEAGDALMLPANSTGTWDIQETVRKTYVLIF